MVGENIQKFREQLQSVRGNFMIGQGGFLGKLTSQGQGILSNFQMGNRITGRLQSIRGMGQAGKTGTTVATVGQYGVYNAPAASPSIPFVTV